MLACTVVHEECPHCNSRFGRAGNTRQHCQTVHEKRRDHKCPHCINPAHSIIRLRVE